VGRSSSVINSAKSSLERAPFRISLRIIYKLCYSYVQNGYLLSSLDFNRNTNRCGMWPELPINAFTEILEPIVFFAFTAKKIGLIRKQQCLLEMRNIITGLTSRPADQERMGAVIGGDPQFVERDLFFQFVAIFGSKLQITYQPSLTHFCFEINRTSLNRNK
jgi:hypothetical protein